MTTATNIYNQLSALSCNSDLTGQDLNGLILTPNKYCYSSSALLSGGGTLTIDGTGYTNPFVIIQTGTTLTTSTGSTVTLINIPIWYNLLIILVMYFGL